MQYPPLVRSPPSFPNVVPYANQGGTPRNYAVLPLWPAYPAQYPVGYPQGMMSNRPLSVPPSSLSPSASGGTPRNNAVPILGYPAQYPVAYALRITSSMPVSDPPSPLPPSVVGGTLRNFTVPPFGSAYPAQYHATYPQGIMSNRPLSGTPSFVPPFAAATLTSSSIITTRPSDQVEG